MNTNYEISDLIAIIEKQGRKPLSIMESGTSVYVIQGATEVNGVLGYPVLKTTSPTANHTYLESGFITEENRVSGSNGSAANVNLKTDEVNTILLLTDASLIYA
tara:strand:+ start:321 stop:632 length:312 start_codon:yes stop_codon:yes gene_type:complete